MHADRDPDGEIDDNFYLFIEAGIGMAIGLYVHNKQAVTNETKGYRIWSAMMRPKYFDIPDDLKSWQTIGEPPARTLSWR